MAEEPDACMIMADSPIDHSSEAVECVRPLFLLIFREGHAW